MNNDFLDAMNFRHACKIFDEDKKISDEEIRSILEVARTSPTSFGMEGWKFLVITNEDLKAKLRPHCWNQVQITSCSHLVILLSAIDSLKPESGVPQKRFSRREMPQDKLDFYVKLYSDHLKDTLSDETRLYEWSTRQTYIAGANMMTYGAYLGIDSCAIEGFDKQKVEEVLELNTKEYQLSMLIPFGYRVKKQSSQMRLDFDEVVEFIN